VGEIFSLISCSFRTFRANIYHAWDTWDLWHLDDADVDEYISQLRFDDGTWCDTIGNGTIRWDCGPRCDREADEICSDNFFRRNILWKSAKIKIIFLDITTRDKQRNKRGMLGLSRGECTLLENNQDPRWILQDNFASLRETEIRRPEINSAIIASNSSFDEPRPFW